jgi:glycosyltransferase involved in cell wall biosynthesis
VSPISTDTLELAPVPTTASRRPSVGLVHDYLLVMRGAERTFAEMATCWPDAPIYTLLHDPAGTNGHFAERHIHSSYVQRMGSRQDTFRRLAPVLPHAVGHLPVSQHDLIVSSSSAFAHGVRPGDGAQHVCYCHSPFRYAWHEQYETTKSVPRPGRPIMRRGLARFRRWDYEAAQRVDHYIANSEITRERLQEYYGRDAYAVIHPPVDVRRFYTGEPHGYLLVVGELVSHKRIEVALEAARRVGQEIKVVGSGPDAERLKALYGDSAQFLGRVSDLELAQLYAGALALVMPNIEEFGITAVEAQAAGRPVVAADGGGARETVIDGETGVLVPPGDIVALSEVIHEVDFSRFSSERIQRHAAQFSVEVFRSKLSEAVAQLTGIGGGEPADPRRLRSDAAGDDSPAAEAPELYAPVPV